MSNLFTRVIVGAEAAYVCITEPGVFTMDIKLPAGKGIGAGLAEVIKKLEADQTHFSVRLARVRAALEHIQLEGECGP